MKILIIHAHGNNRGDEAAVKSMVDEILRVLPEAEIVISKQIKTDYPCMDSRVKQIEKFPKGNSKLEQASFILSIITNGQLAIAKEGKKFLCILKGADLVIHAPGGPSIGDIYKKEWQYLLRLDLIRKMKKPYMFYAPSMGPFKTKRNDKIRKRVLLGAKRVILRDPISTRYLINFMPELPVVQAMDSVFQHEIFEKRVKSAYDDYNELHEYIKRYDKIIGLTITDLSWHPVYGKKREIPKQIENAFRAFIQKLISEKYGIVFIPQLYGEDDDFILMDKYMVNERTFIITNKNDLYDSYFQQYVIGKLYAVVGMRYHSNIFSAKMGTPFVSISYEQKMTGFMESVGLNDYCIEIDDLSYETLTTKFERLEENYDSYFQKLQELHEPMKCTAYQSTQTVIDILQGKI